MGANPSLAWVGLHHPVLIRVGIWRLSQTSGKASGEDYADTCALGLFIVPTHLEARYAIAPVLRSPFRRGMAVLSIICW